jgi:hypothetical protein
MTTAAPKVRYVVHLSHADYQALLALLRQGAPLVSTRTGVLLVMSIWALGLALLALAALSVLFK